MNEIEINARIMALQAQRDEMANRCVIMAGMLALKDERIKELEAELAPKTPILKEVTNEGA